jgi:hypothetical protein
MSSIAGDLNRIHVISGGAPKEVFALLAPKFEQRTGNKVEFTYAVITELREKLGAGGTADVLVLPTSVLDSLARDGKVRGGIVYFDRLNRERPNVRGIITATRGNHGQSLAYTGARAGIAVTIVVPHGNSTEKNAAMRAFGAELIEHGCDFDEARQAAIQLAAERGLEYAPSFD